MTDHDKAKVLITGATGMQGGAALQALLRAGHPVTAFVRNPTSAPAQALAAQGVALAVGDLEDLASLQAASGGHDAVFSLQLPSADPDAEARQARNIAIAAKQAGITQIIHTSVSGTGWRTQHADVATHPALTVYWDQKEAAEDAVRQSGVARWTILKPALFMNNFLPAKREGQFPDLAQGELITAASPQTVMALICADDLGAAVAAAVADPDRFHEAEIELAGDALTYPEIAEVLTTATGQNVKAVFAAKAEQETRMGAPTTDAQIWNDLVGYPARPQHAAAYGLTTTTFEQWAARQDWHTPTT